MALSARTEPVAATSRTAHAVEHTVRIADTGGSTERTLRIGTDGCVALTVERSVS